jgi:thiosulfate dehydrogenase (quinone) large subunit
MNAFATSLARKKWDEFASGGQWRSGKVWSVFLGRIALGFTFLWSGYQKVLTEISGKMATHGFLSGSSVAGSPFAEFFNSLSGNWTVEYLVVGGELAVGLALVFGTLSRLGSIAGFLQMTLFTIAMWPIQDTASANPVFDTRTFYMAIFVMLFFLRPGTFLGGDGILHNLVFVQRHPRVKKILNWIA